MHLLDSPSLFGRNLPIFDPLDNALNPLQLGAHSADAVLESQQSEEMLAWRVDFLSVGSDDLWNLLIVTLFSQASHSAVNLTLVGGPKMVHRDQYLRQLA